MPVLRKVWDTKKGEFIELYSVSAKEAVKNDPKRFSFEKPEPAEKTAPVRQPEAPLSEPVEPEVPAKPRHKK